jgi:transposase
MTDLSKFENAGEVNAYIASLEKEVNDLRAENEVKSKDLKFFQELAATYKSTSDEFQRIGEEWFKRLRALEDENARLRGDKHDHRTIS